MTSYWLGAIVCMIAARYWQHETWIREGGKNLSDRYALFSTVFYFAAFATIIAGAVVNT